MAKENLTNRTENELVTTTMTTIIIGMTKLLTAPITAITIAGIATTITKLVAK